MSWFMLVDVSVGVVDVDDGDVVGVSECRDVSEVKR